MKLIWAIALVTLSACSTYKGQNRVQEDTVKFPGGVYKDKSWDETLVLKRNQFYIGATLYYDILSANIDSSSPFSYWLGEEKNKIDACDDFRVFLIYRNIRRSIPQREVLSQIEKQGGRVMILPDFRRNIREHFVSDEMHFLGHKVVGVCFEGTGKVHSLNLTLPGFKETDLLQ